MHHGTNQCFSLASTRDSVRDTRALGVHNRLHKKKTITTMWARSLLQSHEEDHFEIRNTLVTLEGNTWSIRRAISKSAPLVIRSPAESLEFHPMSIWWHARCLQLQCLLLSKGRVVKRRLLFSQYPPPLSFLPFSFRGSTDAPGSRTLSSAFVRMTSRRENETRPSRLLTWN